MTATNSINSQTSSEEEAEAVREQFEQMIPLGRLGRASELAAAGLSLAATTAAT